MTTERIIEELTPLVARNALISDARHWGSYSMCGLLLRLREQYRFESGLSPGARLDEKGVAEWIGRREALWNDAGSADFLPLRLDGRTCDPFDAETVNSLIRGKSLVYGAGYGLHMKPVFFLARLLETRTEHDLTVYICGREYARDMSMNPAMVQGQDVYARRDVMELLIWGKFEEYSAGRRAGILGHAFGAYGVEAVLDPPTLERIGAEETDAVIRHEHGEAAESRRLGPEWLEMLGHVQEPRSEVFLRSLKDILADTCDEGMLRYIVEGRRRGALGFFLAFLDGYRRLLAAGIREAVADFGDGFSWEAVERARVRTWQAASQSASRILAAWGQPARESLQGEIEREIALAEKPAGSR